MPSLRLGLVAVAVTSLIAVGCHNQPNDDAGPDAGPLEDAGCASNCGDVAVDAPRDTNPSVDAMDAAGDANDSASDDVSDGSTGADTIAVDSGPVDAFDSGPHGDVVGDAPSDSMIDSGPPGPCAPVSGPVRVANEPRSLGRIVPVGAEGAGFVATALSQRLGLDNVFLTRMGTDGIRASDVNVSQQTFSLVRGGAFAPDGVGNIVAYSSNSGGNLDVYLTRVNGTDTPTGAAIQLSNDPQTSEDPQIVAVAGGWVVVWRSRGTMGDASLLGVPVSAAYSVGAVTMLTGPTVVPGSFQLVADGASGVAVAFVSQQTGSSTAFVQRLGTNAAAVGSATMLTMSSSGAMFDSIGAALRADDLVVVGGVQPAGSLMMQRLALSTGVMSAPVTLTALGTSASKPGIALDGATGFAIAYRVVIGGAPALAMVRLDTMLAPREVPTNVFPAAGVGSEVRIASRTDGTYAIGWDTLTASNSTASVEVVRCP